MKFATFGVKGILLLLVPEIKSKEFNRNWHMYCITEKILTIYIIYNYNALWTCIGYINFILILELFHWTTSFYKLVDYKKYIIYNKLYDTFFPQEVDLFPFVVYNIFYPFVIIMTILNCFADLRPTYIHYPRGPVSIGNLLYSLLLFFLLISKII